MNIKLKGRQLLFAITVMLMIGCVTSESKSIALIVPNPYTGMVLWQDHPEVESPFIQLEFAYIGVDELVKDNGRFDFTVLEAKLNASSSRGHGLIIRLYDTYVGELSKVPEFIKTRSDYHATMGTSEGQVTEFPDWGNEAYQKLFLSLLSCIAEKYDSDPRLTYLQIGFGLWGEYHIYDGPMILGKTFPSMGFQKKVMEEMAHLFDELKWSISIDSAIPEVGPFQQNPELKEQAFGLFDDSFMSLEHDVVNRVNHLYFGAERFQIAPIGGEISYYSEKDQREALSKNGVYGRTFVDMVRRYHMSYMIGNDQPSFHSMAKLGNIGAQMGYRFKCLRLYESIDPITGVPFTEVILQNTGTAPIYYTSYLSIGSTRSEVSLVHLMPTEIKTYRIDAKITKETPLEIWSERLLPNQKIQIED